MKKKYQNVENVNHLLVSKLGLTRASSKRNYGHNLHLCTAISMMKWLAPIAEVGKIRVEVSPYNLKLVTNAVEICHIIITQPLLVVLMTIMRNFYISSNFNHTFSRPFFSSK